MVNAMSKSENPQCPICAKYSIRNTMVSLPKVDAFEYSCVRCGTYHLTRVLAHAPGIRDDLRPFLSIAARQAHERGEVVRFDASDLESLAESHRISISERVEKTLLYLAKKGSRPGHIVTVVRSQRPLH